MAARYRPGGSPIPSRENARRYGADSSRRHVRPSVAGGAPVSIERWSLISRSGAQLACRRTRKGGSASSNGRIETGPPSPTPSVTLNDGERELPVKEESDTRGVRNESPLRRASLARESNRS